VHHADEQGAGREPVPVLVPRRIVRRALAPVRMGVKMGDGVIVAMRVE
jgi:hypothetical protein